MRTVHRLAEALRKEAADFLERSLARDPNSPRGATEQTLQLGPSGSWFMVVRVCPCYPPHGDDGITWKVYVRGSQIVQSTGMTAEEALRTVEESIVLMLGDLVGKIVWLSRTGTDPQDILDDMIITEVMES